MAADAERSRPAWWGEGAVIVFLLVGYDRIADLERARVATAESDAAGLLRVERLLHLDVEGALNHVAAGSRVLDQILSLYYDLAHGVVTFSVLALGWLLAVPAYRRARRALVAFNLAGLAVFLVLPVAPPRLLTGYGFVDVVAASGTWGALSSGGAVAQHANAYASMPSLHVASAVWVALFVRSATESRGLRSLAAAHVAVTVAVVLMTGNHYLLDVLAGAALTALSWRCVAAVPALPWPQRSLVGAEGASS